MNTNNSWHGPVLSNNANRPRRFTPGQVPGNRNNSTANPLPPGFEHQFIDPSIPNVVTGRNSNGDPITVPIVGSPPQMDHDETVRIAHISLFGQRPDLIIRFWASGEPQAGSFFGYFFDLLDLEFRPVRPSRDFLVFQAEGPVWLPISTFEYALQNLMRSDPSTGPEKYFVPEGTRLQIVYAGRPIAEFSAPVHPRSLNALGTSVEVPCVELQPYMRR
ncbi:hypothetical protein EV361DRAFT_902907 [Lentinula raphanica]|nr:hypothetical protein C8R42DRAFT_708509 [Lentinula raphanica]KAJ3766164.1 hypothetical protein FB446DRAFT_410332 [Lentinula raphanica]KAJ3972947.1 hypothetical protein EV361DRAFT_902907 [Lentinula raphanica]